VDGGGNILTWIEQAKHESPDGWFFMDCTVREHVFFEGQNQTVMEYCKPQPEIEVEGPAKEIVRALACREDLSAAELDQLQIAGTALGDEAAFTAFVNRRRPQLVRAAASVVGPFDAEDAAQLTLIHLWGIASRFRFLCEVEAWIHTMARRRAYRWLRASQVRATLSLEERMAENHWEPVSRDMPPWGGLFMREIEEEEARLAAQNL
jgi:DNA-directed RNA polymerase specialized sigma24 family protein